MDPVLQRFGDVTIERLDKPKEVEELPSGSESLDLDNEEDAPQKKEKGEAQGMKRVHSDEPSSSNTKKSKVEDEEEEKQKKVDEGELSFSENEMSEYDDESDMESDAELNIDALTGGSKSPSVTDKDGKCDESMQSEEEEEEETSANFLDDLVSEPFEDDDKSDKSDKVEVKEEKDDDYEYDIKEKLKEMGEISFETVKKGEKPKKSESADIDVVVTKKGAEEENVTLPKGGVPMRRNIREVMDETKLDESTLAAQRQEAERLRRVQEQQKLIRELQRQVQQERVLSLLQGGSSKPGPSGTRIGSTVLVKLPNGQTKPMTKLSKRPFELMRVPKSSVPLSKHPRSLIAVKKPGASLTPSVSIAPVGKKQLSTPIAYKPQSDSDSDIEDSKKPISRPKPKEPVATIDISSDDDCIVVSETENEPDDEPDEDPSNSGMHTNDEFNQPDDQGRVVVNIGHPDDEADVYVAPQLSRVIKPHQIGGVRFLFDNVIESTKRFETSSGFGCILAHSMGLGKTLQVVCFSDIFLRHTSAKTILCIMPINTLQNWLAEYNMWTPTEEAAATSPLLAHGEVRPRNFNLHVLNDSHKTLAARAKVIREWTSGGGVLLIGYEQFRLLSLRKNPKSRKKGAVTENVDDDKNKTLFDEVHSALVKPGPDLVICDEGHRIKNSHASISLALKQMQTKRRVVLTGYPLQNNLMEYWCMVDFARPNYLGTKTEFCNMFERPIQNGQCIDSTENDIKLMRYRAHVLHSLLVGFVQRRSHRVLQSALPQKEEYVLLVRMTPFQRKLYETFMNEVVRCQSVPNPLKAFAVCCKIWNHPDVLYYFLKKQAKGDAVDIDLEEVSNATSVESTGKPKRGAPKKATKGKTDNKPAASILPYSNQGETTPKKGNSKKKKDTPPTPVASNSFENAQDNSASGFGFQKNLNFNSDSFSANSNDSGLGSTNQSAPSNYPNSYNQSPGYNSNFPAVKQEPFTNYPFNSSNQNAQYPQQNFHSSENQNFNGSFNQSYPPGSNSGSYSGNSHYNPSNYDSNSSFSSNYSGSYPQNTPGNYTQNNQYSNNQNQNANNFTNTQGSSGNNYSNNQNPNNNSNYSSTQNTSTNYSNPTNTNTNYTSNQNASASNTYSNTQNANANNYPNPSGNYQGSSTYQNYPNMPENNFNAPVKMEYNTSTEGYNYSEPNTGSSYMTNSTVDRSFHSERRNSFEQPANQNFAGQEPNKSTAFSGNYPANASTSYPPDQNHTFNSNFQGANSYQNAPQQPYPASGNTNTFYPNNTNNPTQNYPNTPNTQNQNYSNSSTAAQSTNPQPFAGSNPQQWKNQNQDYKQHGEYFDNFKQPLNPNPDWVKKEEIKLEVGDVKPKINILSDIKLDNFGGPPDVSLDVKPDFVDLKPLESSFNLDKSESSITKLEATVKPPTTPVKDLKDEKPDIINLDDDLKVVENKTLKGSMKEDTGIPYDWAIELLKDYVPGIIENSAKMQILFSIIKESLAISDRLLVFSQSLITLDLVEQFLQSNIIPGEETQKWAKNTSYFRLDGSTSALEREKLINEFNSNPKVYLFLVSTRAGSLGINLIGANRVVVLDASWNPCHDTQAVCRVYRYGQKKQCYVYRLVVDKCLEKKIYDRQINKQGMSDRVVDECNPDAHLTMKDVSTLCWDDEKEEEEKDWSFTKDTYTDPVLKNVMEVHGKCFNKQPFQHESLLVDRKDKQLSQQEKRLAKKGYEREKQASRQPTYSAASAARGHRPVASVRPMQQGDRPARFVNNRWIPAEHWQRQGMTAQEMTLPLDVVIPTNQPEKGNIVLKAGQKVLILKSPKGVYMQLESGKIVAIRTAIKVRGKAEEDAAKAKGILPSTIKNNSSLSVLPQKRVVKPFTPGVAKLNMRSIKQPVPNLVSRIQSVTKKLNSTVKAKPYQIGAEIARAVQEPPELHHISSDDEPPKREGTSTLSERLMESIKEKPSTSKEKAKPGPASLKKRIGKSVLEKLEQSTSSIITENKKPYKDTLDNITNNYQEEENVNENSRTSSHSQNSNHTTTHVISDHELDDEPQYQGTEVIAATDSTQGEQKSDIPAPPVDYGYNYGGYGYQPYPPPPGYPAYPQPATYDPYQQPQYNYGMYPPPPQTYPPQYPPQHPPAPYDYNAHPPQPYPGYPPYPQQYPPTGMYPPPATAPAHPPATYPDYQYNQQPPGAPPPPAPYYPNP